MKNNELILPKKLYNIIQTNLNNTCVINEVENWNDEKAVINIHDAIYIDSFQKLLQIDLDSDIR